MLALVSQPEALGQSAKIYKVLPHLVDREGKHALSPSLYERDAYQAHLRSRPDLRQGLRFDVHWKARNAPAPRLRVEMRGGKQNEPTTFVAETGLKPRWLARCSSASIPESDYVNFGDLLAWRVTIWDGDQLLAEQKSFLW